MYRTPLKNWFIYFYLKDRFTGMGEGERERASELLHSLVHSLHGHSGWCSAGLKPELDPPLGLLCGCGGPRNWAVCCSPRHMSRGLDGKPSSQNLDWLPRGCRHCRWLAYMGYSLPGNGVSLSYRDWSFLIFLIPVLYAFAKIETFF